VSEVAVVVGNPKVGSRTLGVARAVADAATTAAGLGAGGRTEVELAELAPHLFDGEAPDVRDVVEQVSRCSLLVVASPTFKATYTGLLKAFLDWFGATSLSGVTAIPVMVGAGPAHALAVEVHLRPLLVEIAPPCRPGASTSPRTTSPASTPWSGSGWSRRAHASGLRWVGRRGPDPLSSAGTQFRARARASRPRAMTILWISLVPSPMTMSGASR
jgi:FMN reductase